MGCEVPQNIKVLEKLGKPVNVLQIYGSGQTPDLYDEYDRRIQSPAAEGNKVEDAISFGCQPAKNVVSDDVGYHEEMDRSPSGLAFGPYSNQIKSK